MNIPELYNIFCQCGRVTTDTRNCPSGSLFVALRGATFNGNAFARQALEAGCAYAVIDDAEAAGYDASAEHADSRLILVDDALKTLQQLAAHHRRTLKTPVVQITGTNGKTTTKELTAAVLSARFNTLFTLGNLNNHIGVPLTLLRLSAEHQVAIVETGANHPGEIAELSAIADADAGLITNVGRAHLEGFGSFEGVIKTKAELYDYLRCKSGGFIFLNADDEMLVREADGMPCVRYGKPGMGYEIEGEVIACAPFLQLRWRKAGEDWQEVQTQLIGAYNINNVLAAAAVGTHYGVPAADVSKALSGYRPSNQRSEFSDTGRNHLIIDAYNANPTSMAAALDNFSLMPDAEKMVILGEMRELGEASDEEHLRILQRLQTMKCAQVWLVGECFKKALEHSPLSADARVRVFEGVEDVKQTLTATPINHKLILIKGSNGTRLFVLPELL